MAREDFRRLSAQSSEELDSDESVDERINGAFAYLRQISPRPMGPRKVVAQLQMLGADPEACRVLRTLADRRCVT